MTTEIIGFMGLGFGILVQLVTVAFFMGVMWRQGKTSAEKIDRNSYKIDDIRKTVSEIKTHVAIINGSVGNSKESIASLRSDATKLYDEIAEIKQWAPKRRNDYVD